MENRTSENASQRSAAPEFLDEIEAASGANVRICYQCGKCSAGCPVAYAMDLLPSQVMRLVQLGLKDEVLSSSTIWLCASCETCATRCPREIEIVEVMDALRRMASAEGFVHQVREVPVFVRTFLKNLSWFGRLYEAALVGAYNLKSGHIAKDIDKAPEMLLKRKIALLPPRVKGKSEVRRIMKRVSEIEKE
jgi:heterodisulfide reductase subunit C